MKKILALDLGATTGYARNYRHPDEPGAWFGEVTFPGVRSYRLGQYMYWLNTHLRSTAYDVVVYERPFARGLHATRSLWGMAAITEACAETNQMAVLDQTPAAIKKWATGKGNANKTDMQVAALRLLGRWKPKREPSFANGIGEHEADAVCLLKYAEEKIS